MEAVVSYAKNILFFLLFVNLIMQILQGSSYERFVRPVCGMILLIVMLSPLLNLFRGEEKVLLAAEQKISLLFAQKDTEFILEEENGYEFAVLERYEEELIKQLETVLAEEQLCLVSADFNLSAEEKEFGIIRSVSLVAEPDCEEEKKGIEIAPIVFSGKRKEDSVSAEEIRIKDKLADFYQLEEGNIYVSIREEQDG